MKILSTLTWANEIAMLIEYIHPISRSYDRTNKIAAPTNVRSICRVCLFCTCFAKYTYMIGIERQSFLVSCLMQMGANCIFKGVFLQREPKCDVIVKRASAFNAGDSTLAHLLTFRVAQAAPESLGFIYQSFDSTNEFLFCQ